MSLTLKIAFGSFGVSLVVLAIKYTAYLMTGSVALYSDALESIINVATALVAILAIRISGRPADAEHPYGHHKAEYLSAVVVGVLIVLAALAILREAYLGFLSPKEIELPFKGLAVSTVATFLNAGWSWVLIGQGRRHRSAALLSDGKHLMADVVTSFGVVVGVLLVVATGKLVLDAGIAALVALHVLWSGWEVIRDNTSGLLDEAAPPDELAKIRGVISLNAEGAIEAHALKTRQAGKATFIDFHLVVSRDMKTGHAHDICDRIEHALRDQIAGAVISIHVEPEDKAKHEGIPVVG